MRPGFWTGATGKALRKHPDAQRVAFYLMTCPHVQMIGIYNLPILYVWNEVGLTEAQALEAFAVLAGLGFAHRDAEADLVWVPNLAREQVGETCSAKDNKHKAIAKQLRSYRGHPFVDAFLGLYAEPYGLTREDFRSPFEAPSKPLQRGGSRGSGSPYVPALVPDPDPAPAPAPERRPRVSTVSAPEPPTTGDSLTLFAEAWRELTGRSEFGDGCGQYTGTEVQALKDFRRACSGSVDEFRARLTARLANDRNEFNLTQTLIRWSTDLINAPASKPAQQSTEPSYQPFPFGD